MKEFNLSEKMTRNIVDSGLDVEVEEYYIKAKDVKTFIAKLKELIDDDEIISHGMIEKLAGKELIYILIRTNEMYKL